MTSSSQHKGISRIDSGPTHGWFVRAYRNTRTYSRFFSDSKAGGKEPALRLAIQHHAKLVSQLAALPDQPRARRLVFQDSRNTTGVLGVCRTTKRGPKGVVHECYSVSWRPTAGTQRCTSFSIHKYGEKKAFQMAVRHRREMLRQIHGPDVFRRLRSRVPVNMFNASPPAPAQAAPAQGLRPARVERA